MILGIIDDHHIWYSRYSDITVYSGNSEAISASHFMIILAVRVG